MDRHVIESRLKELTHRSERLKRYAVKKAEGSYGELEALLLETVDLTAELTELTREIVEEQLRHSNNNFYGESEIEHDEMFMICPYCHESVNLTLSAMEQQFTNCPHCHSRLQLYSPS